jgi:hypothetical protein
VRRWLRLAARVCETGPDDENGDELGQIRSVKTTAKRHAKSEAELLDQATNNLARALKRDIPFCRRNFRNPNTNKEKPPGH